MLHINRIVFRYPRSPEPVLAGIDLNLPAGQITGLLGPNGAGKTTLISLIAGLLPLQQGSIHLNGKPLIPICIRKENEPDRLRPRDSTQLYSERPKSTMATLSFPMRIGITQAHQQLALVPQDYAFYPMLTVQENLRFFGGVQGLAGAFLQQRIATCCDFAQLNAYQHKRAGELSGGLKRRLNLAIGLLTDPSVLLLDEPTVGVDPQSRHFLLDAIRGLCNRGKTILYTSHYMDEVEAICDRVAIIDQGRILVDGSLLEVTTSGQPVIRLRLAKALPEKLCEQWRQDYALESEAGHSYILPGAPLSALGSLQQQLAAAGCVIQSLSYGAQNLEQVFMRLTKRSLRD